MKYFRIPFFLGLGTFLLQPVSAQTMLLPPKPVWEATQTPPLQNSLQWVAVNEFGAVPPAYGPIPAKMNPAELAALPRVEGPYNRAGSME